MRIAFTTNQTGEAVHEIEYEIGSSSFVQDVCEMLGVEDDGEIEIEVQDVSDATDAAERLIEDFDDIIAIDELIESIPHYHTEGYEILNAWISNMMTMPSSWDTVEEEFQGQYSTEAEFAQYTAESLGLMSEDRSWPYTCIDWDHAANELFMDYWMSDDGYVFRST